jgi:hypothetical protein
MIQGLKVVRYLTAKNDRDHKPDFKSYTALTEIFQIQNSMPLLFFINMKNTCRLFDMPGV